MQVANDSIVALIKSGNYKVAAEVTAALQSVNPPLSEVARIIRNDWAKVNYAAVPYLQALQGLDKITDQYFADDAKSIVLYFLSNATSWRGEVAKGVKAYLKKLAK